MRCSLDHFALERAAKYCAKLAEVDVFEHGVRGDDANSCERGCEVPSSDLRTFSPPRRSACKYVLGVGHRCIVKMFSSDVPWKQRSRPRDDNRSCSAVHVGLPANAASFPCDSSELERSDAGDEAHGESALMCFGTSQGASKVRNALVGLNSKLASGAGFA